jgi:hypothetical protein
VYQQELVIELLDLLGHLANKLDGSLIVALAEQQVGQACLHALLEERTLLLLAPTLMMTMI